MRDSWLLFLLQRGFALSHLGVAGCDRGDAFDKDGRWWYNDCCG